MLRRSIIIYTAYFAQFLKSRMEYKIDFFADIFANVIVALSGLLFIVFLIDGQTVASLKGWSREEVLFIYGYSMLAMGIFNLFAPNLYLFGDKYIIEGQFDRVLLRPLNSLFQVLFESFNLQAIGTVLVGGGLIVYTAVELEIGFGPLDIAWLVISGFSGGIILIAVFVFFSSLSFHFQDRLGIAAPVYNLISFGRYPLPIFNQPLQFILRWLIPFAFVAFYPATHFFSRTGFEVYCYLTPAIALLWVAIASLAWQFGVGRYSSTGN